MVKDSSKDKGMECCACYVVIDRAGESYMSRNTWNYPKELVAALLVFGLDPLPVTPPLLVRAALNDLYRYEIRRLRQRLIDGDVEKSRYVDAVIVLRKRYWPLSLQPVHWERIVTRSAPVPTESLP